MKTKNILLFALSFFTLMIIAVCAINLAGCGLLNFGTDNNQNVEDKLGGEVLGVMAYYLDDNGKIIYNQGNFKDITYGDEFDLKKNIEVRAVGKGGKYAVLQEKTGKADGYTLKINKYTGGEDIYLDGIPSVYEWANYTFEFYYGGYSDKLKLNVARANFLDCGCELVAPDLTYNENFKTPYIANLPTNDDIDVKIYYGETVDGKGVWKEWDFSEEDINTKFLPDVVGIRAVLSAPNYFEQEFNVTCKVNRYSLKNHLELSEDSLEMQYLVKNWSYSEATLSEYNILLQRNLSAYFGIEEIVGTFEFVDGTDTVTTLGNKNLKIKFTNPQTDIYLGEEHIFDITVNFTKFKVAIPTVKDNTISNLRTNQRYTPYGYTFAYDDEEIYNLYYGDRRVVNIECEQQYMPGTYPCSIVLVDKDKCEWANGGTDDIQTTWTLNKGYIRFTSDFRLDTSNSALMPNYSPAYDSETQTYSLGMSVVSGNIPDGFYAYNSHQAYNESTGSIYTEYILVNDIYAYIEIDEEDMYKLNGFYLSEEGIAEATENGSALIHAKISFSQERYTTSVTEIALRLYVRLPSDD